MTNWPYFPRPSGKNTALADIYIYIYKYYIFIYREIIYILLISTYIYIYMYTYGTPTAKHGENLHINFFKLGSPGSPMVDDYFHGAEAGLTAGASSAASSTAYAVDAGKPKG